MGEERKLYRLTGAQRMHYNMIRDYGTQKTSNLSTCAALRAPIDFGLLARCIKVEYERSEVLRVRFTAPDELGNIMQYISPLDDVEGMEIPLEDLSDMSMSEADQVMQNWAYELWEEPDIPMSQFKLVKLPQDYNGFFLHIDHRLADSSALVVLINDIMQIYCNERFGSPYPEPLCPFSRMLEKDLKKANNPKRFSKDVDYWQDELKRLGEPLYSDIRGPRILQECRRRHNDKTLRAADVVTEDLTVNVRDFALGADAVRKLLDFCMTYQVSINNMLLLGLRTYLSKTNGGQEDISIRSFISRRSTKDEWTSGGSRVLAFPCRTVISPDTEFLDAALMVQNVQNHVYLHSNYDTELLDRQIRELYPHPEMTTYESVWLTYQPMPIHIENEFLKNIPIKSTWYPNGAATKKIYLTVSHLEDGGMNFSFHYQAAIHNGHDMEVFYYYLMKIIFKGIEEPDITIGELLNTL